MKKDIGILSVFAIIFFVVLGIFFYTEVINKGTSFYMFTKSDSNDITNNTVVQSIQPKVLQSDPVVGTSNDPIRIVMYGDFFCEPCKKAYTSVKSIIRQKSGERVQWVWKSITNITNTESISSAVAAYCAQKQGKFWEFSELLFANQNSFSTEQYIQYAKILNFNNEVFNSCINDNATKTLVVSQSNNYQKELNINETPVIYINTTRYTDTFDVPALLNAIKNATTEKK